MKIPFSTDRYEKRLIILIDLLGFKDYIQSNYGDSKEEAVKSLTYYFQEKVCEGEKIFKGNIFIIKPTFNFFSDTIIISFPLNMHTQPDGFKAFGNMNMEKYQLLFVAYCLICDIQIHSLQHGLLTRGCMTIGDIYHNKNTWFGPGLIDAHNYESNIAIYPRVILSKSGFEYFSNEVTNEENTMWIKDSDGYFYANYMGGCITKLNNDFCKAHHILREIIVSNVEILSEQKKYYELQKWQWLAMYFNNRNECLRSSHGDNLSENIEV